VRALQSLFMRSVVLLTLAIVLPAATFAQQTTCILQAVEKKLTGPARTDFLEKCEATVRDQCERVADQRRLAGVEKTLFISHCVPMYIGFPKP
jgi:hypothetical protein